MIEDERDAPLTPRNADRPQTGMDAGPALKTRAGTDADGTGTGWNTENPSPWWEIKFSGDPSWDELGWLRIPIVIVAAALVGGITYGLLMLAGAL